MERRKFQRKPFADTINFSVGVLDLRDSKVINLMGTALDISNTGIGIKTDYPLEPGHVLRLDNSITHKVGVVTWSMKVNDNNTYRVGIKFV